MPGPSRINSAIAAFVLKKKLNGGSIKYPDNSKEII